MEAAEAAAEEVVTGVVFDLGEEDYVPLIRRAVAEDLGPGDITSEIAGAGGTRRFVLVAREAGVLCGQKIVEAVVREYGASIRVEWREGVADGRPMPVGRPVAEVTGPAGAILAAERVVLNFLQRLCGVATMTSRYVAAVAGTAARIYDTRKTTPGWRVLEKYAVRCGGGRNHRMGLYDAVLIKDNHLAGIGRGQLAGRVQEMVERAVRLERRPAFVEVEVDTIEQLEELFTVIGIDAILLDNFSVEDLRRAVALRDKRGLRGKVELEASGGVDLDSVRRIAETGVECISVGALTHSVRGVDISLEARGTGG